MNGAIGGGRLEGQAVFVAHELRNLAVRFLKRFGVFREEDAAAGCVGDRLEPRIGVRKTLLCLLDLDAAALFAVAKRCAERDAENAHIAGLQARLQQIDGGVGGSIHASGEQHDGLLAGKAREPVENGIQAGGKIQLAKSKIEADTVQSILRGALVRGEIEQGNRRFGITGDGSV